jgi:hypothetical protein
MAFQIIKNLLARGARQCPPPPQTAEPSDHRFDVNAVTVVIAHNLNFREYEDMAAFNKKSLKLGNGDERKNRKWVVTVRPTQA